MPELKKDDIKKVAALKYVPGEDSAPKIVAIGKGDIADKILEKAKENNVPIYKDETLAHTLSSFNIGDEVPPELYEVVAEILVFVSNLDKNFGVKR